MTNQNLGETVKAVLRGNGQPQVLTLKRKKG